MQVIKNVMFDDDESARIDAARRHHLERAEPHDDINAAALLEHLTAMPCSHELLGRAERVLRNLATSDDGLDALNLVRSAMRLTAPEAPIHPQDSRPLARGSDVNQILAEIESAGERRRVEDRDARRRADDAARALRKSKPPGLT